VLVYRTAERIFHDRADAGRQLGRKLLERGVGGDVIVLGLPRGGVPVACAVAAALDAPVDVLVVRKLGAPFNPELALGSVAAGGVIVYNERILHLLGLDEEALAPILERERQELARREQTYRGDKPLPELRGKTVILVDDGAATGATMHAAVKAVSTLEPERIIVALPTSAVDTVARLATVADEVVSLSTPEPYFSVGTWYQVFDQLSDRDVVDCLDRATAERKNRAAPGR
jgi:putative phosphoribosyl transferase